MTNKQYKLKLLKKEATFSLKQLAIFAIIFGAIGGYILWHSFAAAPVVATLEAERMSLPAGAAVINDTTASAGQGIKLSSPGTLTGSVAFRSNVTSLTITARATAQRCKGNWPSMSLAIDGNSVLPVATVASTGWTGFSANTNLPAATHTITITYTKASTFTKCNQSLYLDVSTFYGPAPPPTPLPGLSLAASPTSVTVGGSSTLTWNSTNANSCTASGAWSGPQPTSGSSTTGALNATSTYSLSCTGSGGTSTASTTVTAATVTPPPPSASTKLIGFASGEGPSTLLDINAQTQYLDTAKAAGAQIIRFAVRSTTQANADSALSGILGRGITPLVDIMPNGLSASQYSSLCDGIARKYGPKGVTLYETGNEPNLSGFWNGAAAPDYVTTWKTRAQDFTSRSNACYSAIKAVQPNAQVATAGLSPWGQPVTTTAGVNDQGANPVLFLDWSLGYGLKADAIGWHPYNFGDNYSVSQMLSTTDVWSAWAQMAWTTPNARSTMAKYGLDLKIWATEWGANTDAGSWTGGVSEQAQADLMTQGIAAWKSYSWAGHLMAYTFADISTQSTNREGHFGVVRSDYSHKPAFTAFSVAAPK